MKSSLLKTGYNFWVCLVNSEHIQDSVLGSWAPNALRLKPPQLPASRTNAYLVPPANPIWSWRLRGGLDARGAPAILRDLPYTHYR